MVTVVGWGPQTAVRIAVAEATATVREYAPDMVQRLLLTACLADRRTARAWGLRRW